MGIITIDTETQSLNTQKFLMGAICDENENIHTFRNKQELWLWLQKKMQRYKTKKNTLFIYAHNMLYDWLCIKPEELPKNYELYCDNPFIMDVRDDNGRIYAKFLSTTSLYRGPLSAMGEDIGYEKSNTPDWLKQEEYEPNFIELNEAERYMKRDVQIVHKYLQRLREFLTRKKIRTRWLITSGQIGMNYLLQHIRVAENNKAFLNSTWYDGTMHPTQYKEEIHEALRGGRVEAQTIGKIQDVSSIDINSHYPHCIATMRIPDLRTEQKIENPKITDTHLQHIGIARAHVIVKKNRFGVLPVRLDNKETTYPNETGQQLIGTWTHKELAQAKQRGYTIKKIDWSIIWEDTANPFTEVMEELAQERLNSTDRLENHFLKMLMNSAIGKFAQRRAERNYEWTEVNFNREQELIEEGYQAVEEEGRWRLYMKEGDYNYPKFYAPILNALITAEGRTRLLELMEEIRGDVHYVDTDGIVADATAIQNATFKYSKNLGGLKLEHKNVNGLIYTRKGIMLDNEVKLSGIPKMWVTPENFRAGRITYKKMRTAGNTHDSTLIGTFTEYDRDLLESANEARKKQQEQAEETLFIDNALSLENLPWNAYTTETT